MKLHSLLKRITASVGLAVIATVIFANLNSASAASLTADNVLNDVNQARVQNGVITLKKNSLLALAAQRKGEDMIKYGYWAHINPTTGVTPWKFILATGYRSRYLGENLAKDFGDTTPLMSAWNASPSHKQIMLSSKYKETGIAVVTGIFNGQNRVIVVQMFGGI